MTIRKTKPQEVFWQICCAIPLKELGNTIFLLMIFICLQTDAGQGFLCIIGLADEFTVEMAKFITQKEDAGPIIQALTEQNALCDSKRCRNPASIFKARGSIRMP